MTSKVYQDLAAGLADQNLAETVMRSVGKAWLSRADLAEFDHETCDLVTPGHHGSGHGKLEAKSLVLTLPDVLAELQNAWVKA